MLTFEGCKSFRYRIVASFLSGKQLNIEKIREDDESPGLQESEVSFLRLIEKLSEGRMCMLVDCFPLAQISFNHSPL